VSIEMKNPQGVADKAVAYQIEAFRTFLEHVDVRGKTVLEIGSDFYLAVRSYLPKGLDRIGRKFAMESLEDYWALGFPNVEGWVDTRLVDSLRLIDITQRSVGIAGQIGEIGVYHGKLLIALAHLADAGDKVTAIDVFEDQARNVDGAGVGNLEILKSNIHLYGPVNLNYEFIKADSISMTSHDKLKLMDSRGPFRLFSVDGCHTAEHTCTDLLTAQDSLCPGGVLILDDFMQPHWPGVTEAVNLFYSRYVPRIKPFLYCFHKLFFVGYGWHDYFVRACSNQLGSRPNAKLTEMFGIGVLSLYP